MTNRIIVLGALFLALAISVNWILEESEQSSEYVQRNDPDLYMLNASINQYDEEGKLQHSVSAQRFTRFPVTDVTTMIQPRIEFGSPEDESAKPWLVSSAEGRLLPASNFREEIVELWDQVSASRVNSENRFIRISTDSLTVYPNRNYVETNSRVVINSQSAQTSAAGLQAYLESGRFVFHGTDQTRVTTRFEPSPGQ